MRPIEARGNRSSFVIKPTKSFGDTPSDLPMPTQMRAAVVLRAVEEALGTGHDFVFLVADAEDWPKELYVRLGFAPLGHTWTFLKTPG